MPTVHGGTLAFPNTISADEVACWLARLFGPHSALPSAQVPTAIELPEGLGSVRLLADLVVASDRSLVVRGGNNILIVGSRQLRIEARAMLTLESLIVADSVKSTAIAVEAGSAIFINSTVRNCSAYLNAVNANWLLESRGGAISVNAAGRLELDFGDLDGNSVAEGEAQSAGGAIYCSGGSSISIARSKLRRNVAHRSGLTDRDLTGMSNGGAIFLKKSSLAVSDSQLLQNVAKDGGFMSQGGAVYGCDGSSLTLRGSRLYENVVENGGLLFSFEHNEDAGCYGGAIYVEYECSVEVIECELCDNIARAGAQWTEMGAIGVYDGCSLLIFRSKLLRNVAHGRGPSGGAVHVVGGERPSTAWINASEISDNRVRSTDDGDTSQGGALYMSQAQLTVVDCKLHRNVASGGLRALGGAFTLEPGSAVLVQRSDFRGNVAERGVRSSYGGGIYSDIQGTGELQIESTELRENCANGSAAPAAGGGLYFASGSATVIDSDFTANVVFGTTAYGGAVYSSPVSGTLLIMIRTRVVKNSALSMGVNGESFGGGIFNGGAMRQVDSHVLENVASIASPAQRASAGGIYNSDGARAILDGCLLHLNTAGGAGLFQVTSFPYDDGSRAAYEASKAAHILTYGRMELMATTVVEGSSFVPIGYAAQRWIVVGGGTLYLRSSNFSALSASAVTDSETGLLLLASLTPEAEILVRQCTVRNLKLQSVAKVGVVNSEFEPPLNNSDCPTLQPGQCASVLVNEPMCDPRALCELRQTAGGALSGGVQCACVGAGMHETPGMLTNGQQCKQDTTIGMLMQSQAVSITLPKPSNGSADFRIVVQAVGESRMVAVYSASMVRQSAGARVSVQPNSSRTWSRLDEPRLSLDGHHVLWVTPPSNDSQFDLDLKQQVFSARKEYVLQLRLDCGGQQPCIADGDKVTTAIDIGDASSPSHQRAAVSITTEVVALVSCQRSVAWLEGGAQSVPLSTAIDVRLRAVDVDAMPIEQTRAEVEFLFGNQTVPVNWNRGSNEYVAIVPAELTGQAGEFELVVTAMHGWDERANQPASCVLLRRQIHVDEGFNSSLVLGISVCSCVGLVVGLVIWVRRRSDKLRHILTMVLTEVGKLIISISFELGDLATCASAALYRWHTRSLWPALIEGRLRCGRVDAGSDVVPRGVRGRVCASRELPRGIRRLRHSGGHLKPRVDRVPHPSRTARAGASDEGHVERCTRRGR
jgi:hypothetical protein